MARPYFEMSGFENVYLADSYVTGIHEYAGRLDIGLLMVLTEKHEQYSPPAPSEQYCYRDSVIIFEDIRSMKWESRTGEFSRDPDGSVDYGNIHSLVQNDDGSFRIDADFGSLELIAAPPRVVFGEYRLSR